MLVPSENFCLECAPRARRRVAVLGSTGSIGVSALDVIRKNGDLFELVALAGHNNLDLLKTQILEFSPRYVALAISANADRLRDLLAGCNALPARPEILSGPESLAEMSSLTEVDCVLIGVAGSAGLPPLVSALRSGKVVALANKECLVMAGPLIRKIMKQSSAKIIPVDSEHSAVFQALQGSCPGDLASITLTASGGPFYKTPIEDLISVTPDQALKHPTWQMGAKISVDSATMMNKALEVIEAAWLFDLEGKQIQVVVHPQSLVHAVLNFKDGSSLAQLSHADMRGPISYALAYPHGRLKNVGKALDLTQGYTLEFMALDEERFPAVSLARECLQSGGISGAVFSVANEAAVEAFLQRGLKFTEIVPRVRDAVEEFGAGEFTEIEELFELEHRVRKHVREQIISKGNKA